MSKRSAQSAGPITRKQQIASLRTMKAQDVADRLAPMIRGAVKLEVGEQLNKIADTMMALIDRVVDLELKLSQDDRDSNDRQGGEETSEVPSYDEVVSDPRGPVIYHSDPDKETEDASG